MKKLLPIALLFFISCNNGSTDLQTEINNLKAKLTETQREMEKANTDETAFIHTVFFWMKKEVTEEQKTDFMKNGLAVLAKAPSIYKVYYGPPAMTPRDVVDNSYGLAWICHFKSKEDQDKYQTDPIHLKFIEDYKHLWDRVQVYDNLIAE